MANIQPFETRFSLEKLAISLFHSVQTGFGAYPASYSTGTANKAAETQS
jgi:hypothetical protein